MSRVDTGWINDENPLPTAARIAKDNFFQTPIDEEDAAARVLDPVLGYVHLTPEGGEERPPWGLFLKDYKSSDW